VDALARLIELENKLWVRRSPDWDFAFRRRAHGTLVHSHDLFGLWRRSTSMRRLLSIRAQFGRERTKSISQEGDAKAVSRFAPSSGISPAKSP
jgi:hypothetical protein